MAEPEVDPTLLACQQQQIINELGEVRGDQRVVLAILQRLDGTVSGLVNEVRAMQLDQRRPAIGIG